MFLFSSTIWGSKCSYFVLNCNIFFYGWKSTSIGLPVFYVCPEFFSSLNMCTCKSITHHFNGITCTVSSYNKWRNLFNVPCFVWWLLATLILLFFFLRWTFCYFFFFNFSLNFYFSLKLFLICYFSGNLSHTVLIECVLNKKKSVHQGREIVPLSYCLREEGPLWGDSEI